MSRTYDLGAIFDEHVADEFVAKDVTATMATMTAEPFVTHVPTMMGGVGGRAVADFYRRYLVGHWPADTEIIPVSRTVGTEGRRRAHLLGSGLAARPGWAARRDDLPVTGAASRKGAGQGGASQPPAAALIIGP